MITCKPPKRWLVHCHACNRTSYYCTGYPGKDWKKGLSETKALFYHPRFIRFQNHIDVCSHEGCGNSDMDKFSLRETGISVLDLFQSMEWLNLAYKDVSRVHDMIDRMRIFIEPCKMDPMHHQNAYEACEFLKEYIKKTLQHIGGKTFEGTF